MAAPSPGPAPRQARGQSLPFPQSSAQLLPQFPLHTELPRMGVRGSCPPWGGTKAGEREPVDPSLRAQAASMWGHLRTGPPDPSTVVPTLHNHLNLAAAADTLRACLEPPCLPAGRNGLRFPSLSGASGPLGSHPCLTHPHQARPAAIHRGAQPATPLHRGNTTQGALSSQAASPRASQIPESELQPSMAPQTTPSDPKTPRSMGPHSLSPP